MALHDSDSCQILLLFHRGEFHGLSGVTLGTFLHLSRPSFHFTELEKKKGIIPHPHVQVSLMLLIVPLTTNLANVLLRSHDFELVQTVSAKKKNHYLAFKRHNVKGISPVHFV